MSSHTPAKGDRYFVPAKLWPKEKPRVHPLGRGWMASVVSSSKGVVKIRCDGEETAPLDRAVFIRECTLVTRREREPSDRDAKRRRTHEKAIEPKDRKKLDEYWRFLYWRMCTRKAMHGDATVVTPPKPPENHILELCSFGNAYRHLDTGTKADGKKFRDMVGLAADARPNKAQLESLLLLCFLHMAGFNSDNCRKWAVAVRGKEDTRPPLPRDKEEALSFADFIETWERLSKWHDGPNPDCPLPKLCAGAGNQVQGGVKWAAALRMFFGASKKEVGNGCCAVAPEQLARWKRVLKVPTAWEPGDGRCAGSINPKKYTLAKTSALLSDVARDVRGAASWRAANQAAQALYCVGDYTGAQGLCTLLFGVCSSAEQLFDNPVDATADMATCCFTGPGPVDSIKRIFGEKNTLKGIQWLQSHQQAEFKRLSLAFPYLVGEGGAPRLLSAVDFEHSLCYFSRYMGIQAKFAGPGGAAKIKELHSLLIDAIKKRRVRRWKIAELRDHSVEGALADAKKRLAAAAD